MTDAAIMGTEYKHEWSLESRSDSFGARMANLQKEKEALQARKKLGGIPNAPTPATTKAEWELIAEEAVRAKDYWRLIDWWGYTCRRFAIEMPLADVLARHRRWGTGYKWTGFNVYWILNGDRCVYVGFGGWGAGSAIKGHKNKRTPLGRYLRGLRNYDGLRCCIVQVRAGNETRKCGLMCRDLEIEKQDPMINERL